MACRHFRCHHPTPSSSRAQVSGHLWRSVTAVPIAVAVAVAVAIVVLESDAPAVIAIVAAIVTAAIVTAALKVATGVVAPGAVLQALHLLLLILQ